MKSENPVPVAAAPVMEADEWRKWLKDRGNFSWVADNELQELQREIDVFCVQGTDAHAPR